jgi:hypothetical protein
MRALLPMMSPNRLACACRFCLARGFGDEAPLRQRVAQDGQHLSFLNGLLMRRTRRASLPRSHSRPTRTR